MKRIAVVLSLLLAIFAVSVQTQNQKPTPPPELKALEMFIGDWTYVGESMESPLGPAGKVSGKHTSRWILNGFFQEWKWVEKTPSGEEEGFEIDWYDSVTKSYYFMGFRSNGNTYSGTQTFIGNNCNWTDTEISKGIEYKGKGEMIFATDGMSYTAKSEISADGKTWKPLGESKFTKVKPAK